MSRKRSSKAAWMPGQGHNVEQPWFINHRKREKKRAKAAKSSRRKNR